MLKTFNKEEDESKPYSPMENDGVWLLEQFMLEIYLLLVHRVKGIGLSLDDFWEMDTWTLSLLYLSELEIIEYEKEQSNKSKGDSYTRSNQNNPEVEALFEEMFEDEMEDY